MTSGRHQPLRVVIEDGQLVLRIGVETLRFAAENHPSFETYEAGNFQHPRVTDAEVFSREVCAWANDETEDGSTPTTKFLDDVIQLAIENGAEGVELPEGDLSS